MESQTTKLIQCNIRPTKTTIYPFKAYSNKSASKSKRSKRRLVLIDIENYCGHGELNAEDIRGAKVNITNDLSLTDSDLIVIGTSHKMNCLISGIEWSGLRQVLVQGHDGADMALMSAVKDYKLESFASVVLISGDGIFASTAMAVRSRNIPFVVATRRESLNRNLGRSATAVRYIQPCASVVRHVQSSATANVTPCASVTRYARSSTRPVA